MGPLSAQQTISRLALIASLVTTLRANDEWRVGPGEAYAPETYCNWNRSGLPPEQQRICEARDRRSPSQKPNLRTLEADNGARFAIDLNSIVHDTNGNAEIVLYPRLDGGPADARRLIFDCRGHYTDASTMGVLYVPPRSVVGRIADIACAKAKR